VIEGRGIVLGAPRSGTTYLMRCLDAVPDAECVTGNLFPIAFLHLAASPPSEEMRVLLDRAFRGALSDYAESAVVQSRVASLRKWWLASRRIGRLCQASRGVRRDDVLIYKEPFLSFAPELAWEALPECRVVYLVRDGRDVADSLVRSYDVLSDERLASLDSNEAPIGRRWRGGVHVPWWVRDGEEDDFVAADPYGRAIWMWREMVARCGEFSERADVRSSGRLLTVRYEDLVCDPLVHGEAIVAHLGGQPTKRVRKRLTEAHSGSIGIHERRERASLAAAEAIAREQLESLGYL
jgi:sulfotransferase family protein